MTVPIASQSEIETRYRAMLRAWNQRDAHAMAACFTDNATMIGFDGSTERGSADIAAHLAPIFRDHPTAAYVPIVAAITELAPGVALLRAEVGMVPQGGDQANPATNAIQCCILLRSPTGWLIELLQNTPAAFHGRPHLSEAMTARLQAHLDSEGVA